MCAREKDTVSEWERANRDRESKREGDRPGEQTTDYNARINIIVLYGRSRSN